MHRLLWIVLILAALPAAGWLYQCLGGLRDRRRYMGAGRWVRLGDGQRLYMLEMGSGPTVVFESGIAATSQNWLALQRAASEFAHTVSYDRAGLGWSSTCKTPRTPSVIVAELRDLLLRAGVAPPYVLVGHSFGGLVVRRFAELHPEEVSGVVLLDTMRPEDWPPLNDTSAATVARGIRLTEMGVWFARLGAARLVITSLLCRSGKISGAIVRATGKGGLHILDRVTCEVGKMPREVWPVVAAHWSSPKYYHGMAAHLRAIPASVTEMHEAAPVTSIPLMLLTAGTAQPLSDVALMKIGQHARQRIAERSGHWVHLDEPDLVLDTIRKMITQMPERDLPREEQELVQEA